MKLVFKETPVFTKLIGDLLSDDEYKELQIHLIENPESGDVIKGTGGLRKFAGPRKMQGKVAVLELSTTGSQKKIRFLCFWPTLKAAKIL